MAEEGTDTRPGDLFTVCLLYLSNVVPGAYITLTEMWPWAWGRWAAKNQSPGKGLLTLKMPEVRLGSVQLRVREKTPGTAVSPGKCVCRGLMTGGAPDRKYTVTLWSGQWSPKVPPCSLKMMRFQTARNVSSGTWKWKSSVLAKERNGLSFRGEQVE